MRKMKKSSRLFGLTAFMVLFMSVCVPSWSEDFKFVKQEQVAKESVLKSSLLSWKGAIRIDGKLEGSVLQIGGTLTVSGQVAADVIALGTEVVLLEDAMVGGDLLLVGGKLDRAETARIRGEYFFVKLGSKEVESTFLPLFWEAKTITLLKFLKIVLWLLIGWMIYALIPGRLHSMSLFVKDGSLVGYGLTGLVTFLVSVTLLLLFTLLSLVIVGIPLLGLLLLAGAALVLVGRTVMMYAAGLGLLRLLNRSNPLLAICCGALVFGLLKFIPLAGSFVLILIDLIGSGIVISYLMMLRKQR